MTYVLLANTSLAISTSSGTTTAIDTTGADLLVVGISEWAGATNLGVLSDNKGNTWTGLTAQAGSISYSRMFYVNNGIVGSSHTFNVQEATPFFAAVFVLAFSGSDNSAFDVENGASTTGTSLATGSITPSRNGSLIVSMAGLADNSVIPYNCTLLTRQAQIAWSSGNNEGGAIAWAAQNAAAAINPTWSWTTSAQGSVTIAAFKSPTLTRRAPSINFFRKR